MGDNGCNDREKRGPIPIRVINRLPVYHRSLSNLLDRGVERISSARLGEKLGLTSSQIRQDFNCFGSFGRRGYGYNIQKLHDEIGKILGINEGMKMVLIGAGNLGKAIANYPKFSQRGFVIKAIFEKDSELVGNKINGIPVYDVEKLDVFLNKCDIDIGIIATPPGPAKQLAKVLIDKGVKGIWNFAPTTFDFNNNVVIENVHISESLFSLSCRIKEE
ncbi:MAG: redox-sensing transcriptional repressor Rex [Bacillota bacterium]